MRRVGLLLLPVLLTSCSARAGTLEDGAAALRAGRYEEAERALRAAATAAPGEARPMRLLAQALAETGRYAEAETALATWSAAQAGSAELLNARGELLWRLGRRDEARAAFDAAIAAGAADALVARANRAELAADAGDRAAARAGFAALVAAWEAGRARTSAELVAVGRAFQWLGGADPQLFKSALRAFDQAAARDPGDFEPRIRAGELFLEKYNAPEALASFQQVLDVNPAHARALAGLARARDFAGERGALDAVEQALATNPQLAEARLFLARLRLAFEDPAAALQEAEAVLALDPHSAPARALVAAAHWLARETTAYERARAEALERHPGSAELEATLAEVAEDNRLYAEAAAFAEAAVGRDASSWRAWGLLGLNQLRLGQIAAGHASLERAFAGDPYHVWIKNTLDLLDTFDKYAELETDGFRFVVHRSEAVLLEPYLRRLAPEALAALAARYGWRPAAPVRVEVYPSHADFSVRTVGLAGLGALGACFGDVLALDSPSAREQGSFNWGSTLWHELSHTVTLGLTGHRVPRWLTEGLAVRDERLARPGWGDDPGLELLVALKRDALLPLERLNEGFVRPRHPGQVALSYLQASLVVEAIEARHGTAALRGLLLAYRDGATTAEAFRRVLGVELADFDRDYLAGLRQRYAGPLAALRLPPEPSAEEAHAEPPAGAAGHAPAAAESVETLVGRAEAEPGDYLVQLRAGRALVAAERPRDALAFLERARSLFPDDASREGPDALLAAAHAALGETDAEAEALSRLTARDETHYDARLALAERLAARNDLAGAAAALEEAVWIYPLDPRLHERRAELSERLSRWDPLVEARVALVALEPADRAGALYRLARARLQAGDHAGARRDVLRALEAAPAYADAQDLLLELSAGREKP